MNLVPLVVVLVAVGGALGATVRHMVDVRVPRGRGVLTANVLACLLSGLLVGSGLVAATPVLGALLISAGGFTLGLGTWSTVAARAADAVLAGRWARAAAVWGAHVGGGLVAAVVGGVAGLALAR